MIQNSLYHSILLQTLPLHLVIITGTFPSHYKMNGLTKQKVWLE